MHWQQFRQLREIKDLTMDKQVKLYNEYLSENMYNEYSAWLNRGGAPGVVGVSPEPTPTITPTITPSISVSPTVTPSISVSPTITPSLSITPTVTPSFSVTPTPTPTPTVSSIPSGYLLQEDNFYVLQEDGSKIIIT